MNSVTDMANGKIDAAAARVETSMANGLTLLISFMAKFIGLGGVGKKVRSVVDEVRKSVQKPVDSTIDWLVDQGEKLFAGGKALLEKGKNAVASGVEKVKNFLFPQKEFKVGKEEHRLYIKDEANPKVIVESTPVTVSTLFQDEPTEPEKKKLKSQALSLESQIVSKAKDYAAEKDPAKKTKITRDINILSESLKSILEHYFPGQKEDTDAALKNSNVEKYIGQEHNKGSVKSGLESLGYSYITDQKDHRKYGQIRKPNESKLKPLFIDDNGLVQFGPKSSMNTVPGLARGDINSNIEGGVPKGYAGHHLIAVSVASEFEVMKKAALLGYDINRKENGIALPTDLNESISKKIPLHSGGHLGEYFKYIRSLLSIAETDYRSGKLSDPMVITEISKIENHIRKAIIQGKIRLQEEGWPT